MRIDPETRLVTLERVDCSWCLHSPEQGKVRAPQYKDCPKCKGTGKRGRGRCSNCNQPGGYKLTPGKKVYYDDDVLTTCGRCNGEYADFDPESYTDNIPTEFHDLLTWKVVHKARHLTGLEQLFGIGIGSCIDYGRHKNQTDEELINHERYRNSIQLCAVVRSKEDLRLADGIAIVTADHGYSMIPYYNEGA